MLQVMQICKKSTSSLFHIIRRCFVPDADKLIHYLPEILYDKEIASGVRELSLIRHAQSVLFGEDNTGFPPWFRREHAFSERYLYRMCNVELLLPFGGVRFCGKWVQESFGNYGDVLWLVARFRVERLLRLLWQRGHFAYSDGVYTSLKAVGYYHFLLCALPEFLHVLKRYPDVKVLLCQDELYPFVGAFLDLLGVRQRICLPPWSRVFVSDYAFSAVESHCGFVPPDDIRLLRDTFLPLAEEGKNCQRIFLSRKKSTRSFSNQAELEDLMGSFGFTVVCLEEMTVLQQISLFRSAIWGCGHS